MRIYSLSDIGVRRRENQDNYWSAILNVDGEEVGTICLCDGMGGLKDGGLASKIVVQTVKDYAMDNTEFINLLSALEEANSKIRGVSAENNSMMGTTCTVVYCKNGIYELYHIGDSRAYLMNSNGMLQLTEDHSAIKKYNIIKEEEPELWNKMKNKLTRCIGVKEQIAPCYYRGEYKEGDSFLLCSDGFWHYLDDHKIDYVDPKKFGQLVNSCIEEGETDNITVCMLVV